MNVTAIYGSPRAGGNSDRLLQAFLTGVRERGVEPRELVLRDLQFSPCIECGGCAKTGVCVLRDDMGAVYPRLAEADVIVLAAPVFFYGMNALAKAMVDRTQCCWVKKHVLGRSPGQGRTGPARGVLLSVGGSRGRKNFDGMLLTARYFFEALDATFEDHLVYGEIDEKGAIERHPEALREARALGARLARAQP